MFMYVENETVVLKKNSAACSLLSHHSSQAPGVRVAVKATVIFSTSTRNCFFFKAYTEALKGTYFTFLCFLS